MATKLGKSLSGAKVPDLKNTNDGETVPMPAPHRVTIVMSQHMGPPCEVQVNTGDEVKVGQVIGDTSEYLSAPIHSSVSGTVKNVEEVLMPNGDRVPAVVIESDGRQSLYEGISPPAITDKGSFIAAVRGSGLVGLGGAGFPTHIKFSPKQQVDTLVVNASECEPYITSDYRAMMEDADDLLDGIRLITRHVGIKQCIIAIEDNKPKAIEKLRGMLPPDGSITVASLQAKYPRGAEKVTIFESTGRVVPEGKLPSDVGIIVSNVTSVAFLGRYMKDGVPLVYRRVTVDGGAVAQPKNVTVPVGTSIKDLMEFSGGYKSEPKKLLYGGPMMGIAVYDDSYPVMKTTNAIIALDASQVEKFAESACIRCGRCVRVCPVRLMPLRIEDAFNRGDLEDLRKYKVNICFECGCCAYVCPSKRHLVQMHRLAKTRLKQAERNGAQK